MDDETADLIGGANFCLRALLAALIDKKVITKGEITEMIDAVMPDALQAFGKTGAIPLLQMKEWIAATGDNEISMSAIFAIPNTDD